MCLVFVCRINIFSFMFIRINVHYVHTKCTHINIFEWITLYLLVLENLQLIYDIVYKSYICKFCMFTQCVSMGNEVICALWMLDWLMSLYYSCLLASHYTETDKVWNLYGTLNTYKLNTHQPISNNLFWHVHIIHVIDSVL